MSAGFESLREMGAEGGVAGQQIAAVLHERKVDALGRAYATGKRKNAIARVWLKPGKGAITINGKTRDEYFARPVLRMMIDQPFQSRGRVRPLLHRDRFGPLGAGGRGASRDLKGAFGFRT